MEKVQALVDAFREEFAGQTTPLFKLQSLLETKAYHHFIMKDEGYLQKILGNELVNSIHLLKLESKQPPNRLGTKSPDKTVENLNPGVNMNI